MTDNPIQKDKISVWLDDQQHSMHLQARIFLILIARNARMISISCDQWQVHGDPIQRPHPAFSWTPTTWHRTTTSLLKGPLIMISDYINFSKTWHQTYPHRAWMFTNAALEWHWKAVRRAIFCKAIVIYVALDRCQMSSDFPSPRSRTFRRKCIWRHLLTWFEQLLMNYYMVYFNIYAP